MPFFFFVNTQLTDKHVLSAELWSITSGLFDDKSPCWRFAASRTGYFLSFWPKNCFLHFITDSEDDLVFCLGFNESPACQSGNVCQVCANLILICVLSCSYLCWKGGAQWKWVAAVSPAGEDTFHYRCDRPELEPQLSGCNDIHIKCWFISPTPIPLHDTSFNIHGQFKKKKRSTQCSDTVPQSRLYLIFNGCLHCHKCSGGR